MYTLSLHIKLIRVVHCTGILISKHHTNIFYIRRKGVYILYIIYILEWIWDEHN